jgi:hypothetical protein
MYIRVRLYHHRLGQQESRREHQRQRQHGGSVYASGKEKPISESSMDFHTEHHSTDESGKQALGNPPADKTNHGNPTAPAGGFLNASIHIPCYIVKQGEGFLLPCSFAVNM